jgi:hypothetical protein
VGTQRKRKQALGGMGGGRHGRKVRQGGRGRNGGSGLGDSRVAWPPTARQVKNPHALVKER